MGVYVDDSIIFAAKTDEQLQDVKDLGKLHYFLGMSVVRKRVDMDWSTCVHGKSID